MAYTIHSRPAIAGGVLASAAATALLMRDAFVTGWTLDHALMPVLVGLTVLTSHLCWQALRERKLISAAGMMILAVVGSTITVYETMGRRAEVRDLKVASATKSAEHVAQIAADYAKARAMVIQSQGWVADECKSGRGKRCEGQTFTLRQREAYAKQLEQELSGLQAAPPVDPKAERVAALAALFGWSPQRAKMAVQIFEPFVFPLMLELSAIFLFGFGIRHSMTTFERQLTPAEIDDLRPLVTPENDPPPGNRTNVVDHPVIVALRSADRPLSNRELARRMGVSEGEASKRWQEVSDQVQASRDGKWRRIELRRATG